MNISTPSQKSKKKSFGAAILKKPKFGQISSLIHV